MDYISVACFAEDYVNALFAQTNSDPKKDTVTSANALKRLLRDAIVKYPHYVQTNEKLANKARMN